MIATHGKVRAVFLGFSDVTFEAMRRDAGPNDWLVDLPPGKQRALVEFVSEASAVMFEECERLGLPWFDLASGFDRQLDAAFAQLGGR